MATAGKFFSAEQVADIEKAIREAEKNTSGEIRVHIENHCIGDELNCAGKVFLRLGMHRTALHNGILFYLALKDRKFAVVGDKGIHQHVKEEFWNTVRDRVMEDFRKDRFAEGLCEGIRMTGQELKKYFPVSQDDQNELTNEVTFGPQ